MTRDELNSQWRMATLAFYSAQAMRNGTGGEMLSKLAATKAAAQRIAVLCDQIPSDVKLFDDAGEQLVKATAEASRIPSLWDDEAIEKSLEKEW